MKESIIEVGEPALNEAVNLMIDERVFKRARTTNNYRGSAVDAWKALIYIFTSSDKFLAERLRHHMDKEFGEVPHDYDPEDRSYKNRASLVDSVRLCDCILRTLVDDQRRANKKPALRRTKI